MALITVKIISLLCINSVLKLIYDLHYILLFNIYLLFVFFGEGEYLVFNLYLFF